MKQLDVITVERSRLAEEALMKAGAYDVARAYILYRQKRTDIRSVRERFEELIAIPELHDLLLGLEEDFDQETYSNKQLLQRYEAMRRPDASPDESLHTLLQAAIELVSQEAPKWEMVAGRIATLIYQRRVDEFCAKYSLIRFTRFTS